MWMLDYAPWCDENDNANGNGFVSVYFGRVTMCWMKDGSLIYKENGGIK